MVEAIVPVFNGERHIASAVASLLAQTRSLNRIIVVDDGSGDETPELIRREFPRELNSGYLVMATHPANMGVSHARNTGLAIATSDKIPAG
jgi:glycosyltransferase involved in cell wall biosynthesis